MAAEVIPLYPVELMEAIKESTAKWNEGLISRAQMDEEITLFLIGYKRNQIYVPEIKLYIALKTDGYLLYDTAIISGNNCCPNCSNYFYDYAVTLYINQGIGHDKYIYACSCGSFFACYNPKD